MTSRAAASTPHPAIMPVLVIVAAALLYLPRFGDPDAFLSSDELFSALTSQSVATTGRDLNGRHLPLLFEMPAGFRQSFWFPPIPIYAGAAVLHILPFTEATIQLPVAIFAIVDVLLVYLIARRLLSREWYAVAAAALVATSPAHFRYGRTALTYMAHLPFICGWLLCVVHYLGDRHRGWLVGAGLSLGVGLHTYAAAYVLMPLYLALTCVLLWTLPGRTRSLFALLGGFLFPAVIAAAALLWRTTGAADLAQHYQNNEGQFEGAVDSGTLSGAGARLAAYARVYASFWTPHFWFVGPLGAQVARPFLVGVAGLFAAAAVRAVTRPTPTLFLLLGGLVGAAVPASLVNQPGMAHRVLAMIPFGALLAVLGLEYIFTASAARTRTIAFFAVWIAAVGLAYFHVTELLDGQALVRSATVPLAVVGLAVVLSAFESDRTPSAWLLAVGPPVLLVMHVAYRIVAGPMLVNASIALLAALSLAPLWPGPASRVFRSPVAALVALAVLTGQFVHAYVDAAPSMPAVRPPLMHLLQLLSACGAFFVAAWLARRTTRTPARFALPPAWIALAVIQLAYFDIDFFPDFARRFVQATGVIGIAVVLARLHRARAGEWLTLGQITAAALVVPAAIQFGRVLSWDFAGTLPARPVFEAVIARARDGAVPATYVGGTHLDTFYWRFYALKHGRADLLERTVVRTQLESGEIPELSSKLPELPPGSLAVLARSTAEDAAVAKAIASGVVTGDAFTGSDGTPSYWVLQRRGP